MNGLKHRLEPPKTEALELKHVSTLKLVAHELPRTSRLVLTLTLSVPVRTP